MTVHRHTFAPRSIETCSGDGGEESTSRSSGHPRPGTPEATTIPPSGHPTPTALSTCTLLSAVSSHDDTDNRCRRYDPTVTGLQNLRTPHAKSGENRLRRLEFLRRRLPLDRDQLTTRPQQPGGPANELLQRRHRPRRGHVRPYRRGRLLLCPGSDHRNVRQSSSRTHSSRKTERRSSGSSRITWSEGRSIASTIPGRPAPEPMSTSSPRSGTSSATSAQFTRCRSHSRAVSRGPISPRVTPSVASSSA